MFSFRERDGVKLLRADRVGGPGFRHGFSTRLGGASRGVWESLNLGFCSEDSAVAVRANWGRFLAAVGLRDVPLAYATQEHGTTLLRVGRANCRGDVTCRGTGDALWTDEPGLALAVVTADCVPVLLLGAGRRPFVAAVHAGWRGLAANIVGLTLARLAEKVPFDPADVTLVAGPSVGPCCYVVGPDVAEVFAGLGPEVRACLTPAEGGRSRLDLRGVLRIQARSSGLAPERSLICDRCTCCHEDLFFSYRRAGGAERGRMAAVVAIAPARASGADQGGSEPEASHGD